MKINDLLLKDAMIMDLQATDKKGAIDEMVAKLYEVGRISDIAVYKEGILAREAQTSTGLGDGLSQCLMRKIKQSMKRLFYLLKVKPVWIMRHWMVNLLTSSS